MKHLSNPYPIDSTIHDLKVFINSCHSAIAIKTPEEKRVSHILRSTVPQLNIEFEEWTVTAGIQNKHTKGRKLIDTYKPAGLISYMAQRQGEVVYLLKDFHLHLNEPLLIRYFKELLQRFSKSRSTIFLTGDGIELPRDIHQWVIWYDLRIPSEMELKEVIKSVYTFLSNRHRLAYKLDGEGEKKLLFALRGLTLEQARQIVAFAFLENQVLSHEDIPGILKKKARLINEGGLLEFLPSSDNSSRLGGFGNLKNWLNKIQVGFSEKARRVNLPVPKGFLMVGVPGCGKSLAAKVVARVWGYPLLKFDTGKLFDKYIGESEKNFRKCIEIAEAMSPCVLWIDEIEKALPFGAGKSENDGGLGQRLFGYFLTWLQEKKKAVFVVATANQIHQMPPELLRKGRFDEIFFVDLPLKEARKEIFKIHLTQRNLSPEDYNLDDLARQSDGMSGAEIEQAVLSSLYSCLNKKIKHDTNLILEELRLIIPLSQSRKEFIDGLRNQYKSRFVDAHG